MAEEDRERGGKIDSDVTVQVRRNAALREGVPIAQVQRAEASEQKDGVLKGRFRHP